MTRQSHHAIPVTIPPANCFTALVVDDMTANRELLRKLLTRWGYGVLEAVDGQEAIEIIKHAGIKPDIVITDVEMPGMDGISLIEEIRKMSGPLALVPIIAASGNWNEGFTTRARAAGSDSILAKPFDVARLRTEISTLLKSTVPGQQVRTPEAGVSVVPNRVAQALKKKMHQD